MCHPRTTRYDLGLKVLALSIAATFPLPAASEDPLLSASQALAGGAAHGAVEILADFVQRHPRNADGQRLLGIALSLVDRRSAAVGALESAVDLGPDNPANHLALGQALSRFGANRRAQQAFGRALELDPALGPAHEGLALLLARQGAVEDSLPHFTSAIRLSDQPQVKARRHYLRGRAYAQVDRPAPAASDFEAAISLHSQLGPAYLELGRILADHDDPGKAIRVLQKAVKLVDESFDAHYLLGTQLLRSGAGVAAVAALQRAAELDPTSQPAAYALGRALRAAGREEEARRHLANIARAGARRAVDEADVTEAGRLNDLGLGAEAAGNLARALAHYEAAIEIVPDNVLFQRNAALLLCRLERWDEAKDRLRAVLQMAPGDIDATTALHIALDHAPDGP